MRDAEAMILLKRVSRSFYLSVRLLPAPMRRGVCLGYLLARASDTIADTQKNPAVLDAFEERLRTGCPGHGGARNSRVGIPGAPTSSLACEWDANGLSFTASSLAPSFAMPTRTSALPGATRELAKKANLPKATALGILPSAIHTAPNHRGEQQLLAQLPAVFEALDSLPDAESTLIREVVATIISGQRLDMERFAAADAEHVVKLANAAELDDYTWRVAGSVGQFWTRLGFLTLGPRFSAMDPDPLEAMGIRFGQGLQLVNILRDTHADLAEGRGYLPTERNEWMGQARKNLADGLAYARAMHLKRLHIAVALPARIGIDTLDAIEAAGPAALENRVKISRSRVWRHFATACKSSLSRRRG